MEALKEFIEVFLKNTNFVFLSIVFGLIGTVLNPRNRTLWAYLVSLFTAIALGVFVGYYLSDSGVKDSYAYVIVAVVSVVAKDLIEFLILTTSHINQKSSQIVDLIIKKYLDKNK